MQVIIYHKAQQLNNLQKLIFYNWYSYDVMTLQMSGISIKLSYSCITILICVFSFIFIQYLLTIRCVYEISLDMLNFKTILFSIVSRDEPFVCTQRL